MIVHSWLAVVLALGAVSALTLRIGPLRARVAALLVMLAVALMPLLPPRSASTAVPTRMTVVHTGAPTDPLAAALAKARLRSGPRVDELAVVWDGALTERDASAAVPVGFAGTVAAPLPWSPTAPQVRLLAAPRAGRPLPLAVSAVGAGVALSIALSVRSPDGVVWAEQVELAAGAAVQLEHLPDVPGEHVVELQTAIGDRRLIRRGSFTCAAPEPVLVVEAGGGIAAALLAQGVRVETVDALPVDLGPFAAVVLGQALPVGAQERLVQAVDDGLGVFAAGPGLQAAGEPLRALWPVHLQAGAAGSGDGPGDGSGEGLPTNQPPQPQPPEARPPERPAPENQPPRPPANDPPVGDVGDAQVDPGGPVEVDKHAVAVVFVVDRSGSMGNLVVGGANKMSFVKTSARATARALSAGDAVGIVTFGTRDQGRVELPLTDAAEAAAIERGIAALAHANESTYLYSALHLAGEMLTRSRAAVRHVLVLTDGEFYDGGLKLQALCGQLRDQQHATVSIVSIVGDDTDPDFLRNAELMTRRGGGTFLPVQDPTFVPRLVSAEVVQALGRAGRKPAAQPGPPTDPGAGQPTTEPGPAQPPDPRPDEAPVEPAEPPPTADPSRPEAAPRSLAVRAVSDSPLLAPVPTPRWPSLGGAAPATAALDANVLLIAGEHGQPLLAYANRGLGRVGAFASDLAGAEGEEFRANEAYPAWLAQWVSAVVRARPTPPIDVLDETEVTPPGPTPTERAMLEALAGAPLAADAQPVAPPDAAALTFVDVADRAAPWLLAALVLLALVEWFGARRWLPHA